MIAMAAHYKFQRQQFVGLEGAPLANLTIGRLILLFGELTFKTIV